ncbi:MAG: class I SAM-dependent methyltransferase [bacterium]|nr:class I SAM-dependent methyltransferase [bacterium]
MKSMAPWEKFFEEKIRLIAKRKRILDVGGGTPLQKQLGAYRELFKETEYVVIDKNYESAGVVKGDAHNLPFQDESFDAVICKSVLEHVEDPFRVVAELRRVLKPGGLGLIYVPFLFPYHAEKGFYADYWRFTGDGVKMLFKDFSSVEMVKVRGFFETVAYLLPYVRVFAPVARLLDWLVPSKNQTSGFTIFVTK